MELLVKILSFAVRLCYMNACVQCVVRYWRGVSVCSASMCFIMQAPLFNVATAVVSVIGFACLQCLREHSLRAFLARCIDYYIAPGGENHWVWQRISRRC